MKFVMGFMLCVLVLLVGGGQKVFAASSPYPANGGEFLRFDGAYAPFEWQAHQDAASFEVFFGPWPGMVSRATAEEPGDGVHVFTTDEPSFAPWMLDFADGADHYWRVDTHLADGAVLRGPIWRFQTADWDGDVFKERGDETLLMMRDRLARPDGGFWEDMNRNQAAFAWPITIALLATAGAAQLDYSAHAADMEALIRFKNLYRTFHNGVWGYDCVINPGTVNRFYDDNTWVAWSLAQAYQVTGDEEWLDKAREAFAFALTGETLRFGGGLLWKETQFPEDPPPMMSMSSTSGAAMAAAILYRLTEDEEYRRHAERLLDFIQTAMRDGEGQIMNDITRNDEGELVIGRSLWSYNTAVPVIAYAELYAATGEAHYLADAKDLAEVLIRYYFNTVEGTLNCHGYFAFTIVEAFARLYNITGSNRYLSVISSALNRLYQSRDPQGFFPRSWNNTTGAPVANELHLLINMPAARAFYTAAAIEPAGALQPDNISPNRLLAVLIGVTVGPALILLVIAKIIFSRRKGLRKY